MGLAPSCSRTRTTAESLAKLRPAFDKAGNITAGNASQISDGGAAVIVTSKDKAHELGLTPMAEILGYGQVAGPDSTLRGPHWPSMSGCRRRATSSPPGRHTPSSTSRSTANAIRRIFAMIWSNCFGVID